MLKLLPVSRRAARLLAVLVLVISSGLMADRPAQAAPITPEAALVRVLTVTPIQAAWFAPSFLAQVSLTQIRQAAAGILADLGPYKSVSAQSNGSYLVRFTRGTAVAQIHLDSASRIDGLLINNIHQTVAPPPTTISAKAALERLFASALILPTWFSPAIQAHNGVARIEQAIAEMEAALGAYKGVDALPAGTFMVRFQYGSATISVHLDASHRISGFLVKSAQFPPSTRATALRAFQHLPGEVSLLALRNGSAQLEINANHPLAVGSAFKLAVIAALEQQVAALHLAWNQKITLLASDKSLPSGELQSHATGSTYTIADVARYMISISDNTAANMLIRVVGRAAIDPLIPTADQPILTTREFFILKDPANSALRERYLAAKTPAARLAILPQVDRLSLPPVTVFTGNKPVAPAIEWFFSTKQLCGLISKVAMLPEMSVNPGLASPADWKHIAYKGGSEVGVINLTTDVTAKDGTNYCVSATWNDTSAAVNEPEFNMLYANILNSFR